MEDLVPLSRKRQIQDFILGGCSPSQANILHSQSLGNVEEVCSWQPFRAPHGREHCCNRTPHEGGPAFHQSLQRRVHSLVAGADVLTVLA